jgi:hypothetical protein
MPAAVANMQREIELLRAKLQDMEAARDDCYRWIDECSAAFEAVKAAVNNASKVIPSKEANHGT